MQSAFSLILWFIPDHSTDEANRELEELYGGIVSKEELARLDSQPNPFNFSERVSQTTRLNIKVPHKW